MGVILKFKKKENLNKILFLVISKSGNTIETLSNLFSLNIIKKNSKNILIISQKNTILYSLDKQAPTRLQIKLSIDHQPIFYAQ